jgi:hypothetical protein
MRYLYSVFMTPISPCQELRVVRVTAIPLCKPVTSLHVRAYMKQYAPFYHSYKSERRPAYHSHILSVFAELEMAPTSLIGFGVAEERYTRPNA